MRTCSIKDCNRKHQARGYCGAHYNKILRPDRHVTQIICDTCCTEYTTTRTDGRYCSLPCRDQAMREQKRGQYRERPPKPPKPPKAPRKPRDQRSALRKAIEDGGDVLAAVRANCNTTPAGCWEWKGKLKGGYPVATIAGVWTPIHRLALETKLGQSLGKQPAHHMCGNSGCVNPEHLQPVTHAENTAEMLARNYMLTRIADLEAALAAIDPKNPLLNEVGVPKR